MKSGKWRLAAVAVALLAVAVPAAGGLQAAEKDSRAPIYNKAGSRDSGGPVSFSKSRTRDTGSDELPFSERMRIKKTELHERIAAAAREREIETQIMVDRANAEVALRAAQESQQQDGGYDAPAGNEPQKNYVYDPDRKKKDDAPSIVVTPDNNAGQPDDGPFRVFKFNKNK